MVVYLFGWCVRARWRRFRPPSPRPPLPTEAKTHPNPSRLQGCITREWMQITFSHLLWNPNISGIMMYSRRVGIGGFAYQNWNTVYVCRCELTIQRIPPTCRGWLIIASAAARREAPSSSIFLWVSVLCIVFLSSGTFFFAVCLELLSSWPAY